MTVSRILGQKGRAVLTANPEENLQEACRLLAEHRIGAVVIGGPAGAVAGILSERDIVRALALRGDAALADPIATHMTKRVVTCTEAQSVNEVMEMMSAGKFRHVPVVKDGRLDGMISIGDVVKFRLAELESESRALRDYITAS